jgi:hypothetical protein
MASGRSCKSKGISLNDKAGVRSSSPPTISHGARAEEAAAVPGYFYQQPWDTFIGRQSVACSWAVAAALDRYAICLNVLSLNTNGLVASSN